jgi:hypothetical protein
MRGAAAIDDACGVCGPPVDIARAKAVANLPQCGKNRPRERRLPTPDRVTFWIVSKSSHIACLRAHEARERIVNARGNAAGTQWPGPSRAKARPRRSEYYQGTFLYAF